MGGRLWANSQIGSPRTCDYPDGSYCRHPGLDPGSRCLSTPPTAQRIRANTRSGTPGQARGDERGPPSHARRCACPRDVHHPIPAMARRLTYMSWFSARCYGNACTDITTGVMVNRSQHHTLASIHSRQCSAAWAGHLRENRCRQKSAPNTVHRLCPGKVVSTRHPLGDLEQYQVRHSSDDRCAHKLGHQPPFHPLQTTCR